MQIEQHLPHAFAQGVNAVYLPFRIPREHFPHSLHAMEALDVSGYSVTIPHKVAALELAQTKIEPVAEIGALIRRAQRTENLRKLLLQLGPFRSRLRLLAMSGELHTDAACA